MRRAFAIAFVVGIAVDSTAVAPVALQRGGQPVASTATNQSPWPVEPAARAARVPFTGSWRLVSTAGRKGYLAYDPAGYMSLAVQAQGRLAIAGAQPTPREMRSALDTYLGHWGTFVVNPPAGVLTHQTFGAVSPDTSGLNITRRFELSGNRLVLGPAPGDSDRTTLVWERLPDLPTLTATHRKLIGFWKLVTWERRNGKGDVEALRPGQTGFIVYTASGHIMVHMMDAYRRRNVGGVPTPEETVAAYRSYTGYLGSYSVNEAEGYVVHHIEGTMNSGPVGTDYQRFLEFSGKRLILKPPVTKTPEGDVQITLTWERISE
jgi:hypothetical protein